jgi:hypothetical protein
MFHHDTATARPLELQPLSGEDSNGHGVDDVHTMEEHFGDNSAELGKGDARELNDRTVRKLDFILLPFLATLFLFNSLDRSNVSLFANVTSPDKSANEV